MNVAVWQIISHAGITLIAVVTLVVRIEHRLTKIETDVSWMKQRVQWELRKEYGHEENQEVD